MSKTIVCYHADCTDGLVAAWVVRRVMKLINTEAVYLPIAYTVPETIPAFEPGDTVVAVDFSWSGETLRTAFTEAKKVVVLDHHKGAIDKINSYFERHTLPDNVELVLDTTQSGAGLAWNYYNHGVALSDIVKFAQDYDLWKFEFKETRAYIKNLQFNHASFEGLDLLDYASVSGCLKVGKVLLEQEDRHAQYHLDNDMVMVEFEGYRIPLLNVPRYLTSAVGDKLLTTTDHPFVLMYRDVGVDRKWSLRSRKGGVDVSILAQRWAGNGHPSAAGFVTRINDDVVYYLEE